MVFSTLFTPYGDVNPGEYDEYSKFISEEFNPGLEKLGVELVGGALTMTRLLYKIMLPISLKMIPTVSTVQRGMQG